METLKEVVASRHRVGGEPGRYFLTYQNAQVHTMGFSIAVAFIISHVAAMFYFALLQILRVSCVFKFLPAAFGRPEVLDIFPLIVHVD